MSEAIRAKRQRNISIESKSGLGMDTKVVDLATGEPISNVYRVTFDVAADGMAEAVVYTHLALLDYEGWADIVGVSHKAITDAIRQTLTEAGLAVELQGKLIERILHLIFEQ